MGSLSLHTSVQVVLICFYDHRCQGYMTNVLTHAPYTHMVCGLCGRSGYNVKNCDIPGAEKYRQLLVLPLVFFSVALVSSFFSLEYTLNISFPVRLLRSSQQKRPGVLRQPQKGRRPPRLGKKVWGKFRKEANKKYSGTQHAQKVRKKKNESQEAHRYSSICRRADSKLESFGECRLLKKLEQLSAVPIWFGSSLCVLPGKTMWWSNAKSWLADTVAIWCKVPPG